MNLLDILLIFKFLIMIRIVGVGNLGGKNFLMIFIGGKFILIVGNSFLEKMINLI